MNTKRNIIIGTSVLLAGGLAYWYFFRKDETTQPNINKRETITLSKA